MQAQNVQFTHEAKKTKMSAIKKKQSVKKNSIISNSHLEYH